MAPEPRALADWRTVLSRLRHDRLKSLGAAYVWHDDHWHIDVGELRQCGSYQLPAARADSAGDDVDRRGASTQRLAWTIAHGLSFRAPNRGL